jgi:hypothetical protein
VTNEENEQASERACVIKAQRARERAVKSLFHHHFYGKIKNERN